MVPCLQLGGCNWLEGAAPKGNDDGQAAGAGGRHLPLQL